MKKQKRQFIILLALVVLICAAYAGVKFYNQRQQEKEKKQEEENKVTVTQMETSDVTAFSYELNGTTLSFTKNGEDWVYDGDTAIDIDEETVKTMLSSATALTAEEEVTDYENLSDFGLEHPSNTITLKTGENEITLYVGDKNAITSQYYIKTADSDTVYLIGTTLPSEFNKTIEELTAEDATETATEETETATEETETVTETTGEN